MALLPPYINREAEAQSVSLNAANYLRIYYIPIYFQALDGLSPEESGIRYLPLIVATCSHSPTRSLQLPLPQSSCNPLTLW